MVAVSIQAYPARCSVAFGSISELRTAPPGKLAIFAPGKIVAYAVKCAPWQALYLFRTTATEDSATHLKGVSEPVNLLYVANTRRTVDKTLTALRGLRARIGERRHRRPPGYLLAQARGLHRAARSPDSEPRHSAPRSRRRCLARLCPPSTPAAAGPTR